MKGAHSYHKTISKAARIGIGDLKPYKGDKVKQVGTKFHYKNIVFVLSSHKHGLTFDIYITDSKGAFKVYGPLSGTVGSSEKYGWIHKGNWADFITNYLIELEKSVIKEEKKLANKAKKEEAKQKESINRFKIAFEEHVLKETKKIKKAKEDE